MYSKPMLGLDQCRAAIDAMMADFNRDPNRRPVDIAVVDDAGNLLAYARMDKCRRPTFAMDKAYTAAVRGVDTKTFAEQLRNQGRSVSEFGDPKLTLIGGGVVITDSSGSVMGGIGVGGLPTGDEDEAISKAGLKALGL